MDLSVVRRRLEERERLLSPYAAKSFESRGREAPQEPSPVRTEFQRDRDRIIHSKAFRRLKHKTQVFIAPVGDHFVTRLTHTLEVAQIARTITRALNLNEDLAEAAALGHDLGHPPFGHTGEQALSDELRALGGDEGSAPAPEGFRHAEQSLRVVEKLARRPGGQTGLNLTWEVRDAIVNSSKVREDILAEGYGTPATLEGQVVKLSDAVAYINHDIGDAIRAGLISEEELPREVTETLGSRHSQRIDTLVRDIVEHSWSATGDPSTGSGRAEGPRIGMSEGVLAAANVLREFMFQRVYLWEGRREEAEQAKQVVRFLFRHYLSRPEEIDSDFVIASDPP
ncbi:MAG: deoxyguanosinetriphosphate triphosphohydrolase, partial [Chloroflexi bacterium]|nr:deoxyguanosinetriphosphate triphosphohydrolase [Chloroflexota bacterium]